MFSFTAIDILIAIIVINAIFMTIHWLRTGRRTLIEFVDEKIRSLNPRRKK